MDDSPLADDELITAWGLMMEAVNAVRSRLTAHVEAGGLHLSEFDVLIRLARAPGGRVQMTQLAREIGLSSGGFTKLADRMVDKGMITREHGSQDRRAVFAAITTQGRDVVAGMIDQHVADLRRLIEVPTGSRRVRELATISRELRHRTAEECAEAHDSDCPEAM